MTTADIFYDTGLRIEQQVQRLMPFLRAWIGDDYSGYYHPNIDYYAYKPSEKFLFALGRNNSYGETDQDQDRFRYKLTYIDMEGRYTDEENIVRIAEVLNIFWANQIPTFAPTLSEELPFGGGESGPVEWPK